MNPKGYVDFCSKIIGELSLQAEFAIGYVLAIAGIIGLILSILLLIALAIPLKGSTRSCLYAAGSVISFFIGGSYPVVLFMTPFPPSPYFAIGWYNVLGILLGYLLLVLAIFQYRRDRV
jgi:hypothetical protein